MHKTFERDFGKCILIIISSSYKFLFIFICKFFDKRSHSFLSRKYLIEIECKWNAIRNMYICRSSYYRYTWHDKIIYKCPSPLIKCASRNKVSECNKVLSLNIITNNSARANNRFYRWRQINAARDKFYDCGALTRYLIF